MRSKERVLALLEQNKDKYVSGEAIALDLGISRNAVWKCINELRKMGYVIDAVNNKGYQLNHTNDIISKEGIMSYLNLPKKDKLNSNILIYDCLDSTNKTAKEMAISGECHGTLIVAKKQVAGVGHNENAFYSPDGGIYMSIILLPKEMPNTKSSAITNLLGQSVCNAIEKLCNVSTTIKPVNDIYINKRKVCGILTESGIEFDTGLVKWIVVGIGINFDSDIQGFPKELQNNIGSIFPPGLAKITKNQLIAEIYNEVTLSTIR